MVKSNKKTAPVTIKRSFGTVLSREVYSARIHYPYNHLTTLEYKNVGSMHKEGKHE